MIKGLALPRLLDTLTITAAGTVTGAPVYIGPDAAFLTFEAIFTYGSGGSTAKSYLQTSLDGGATWIDIGHASFTTATASKLFPINGVGSMPAATAPTDGSLAADTVLDGVLGEFIRTKVVTTGTYAGGTTLLIAAVAKTGAAAKPAALGQATASASMPVVQPATVVSGLSANALNADLVPSTDVSAYRWLSLQIDGTWSGTLSFQGSNDNTTWFATGLVDVTDTVITNRTVTTTNRLVYGPTNCKYVRVRMTAYSSGSATGTLSLFGAPGAMHPAPQGVNQSGLWNVGTLPLTSGGLDAYRNLDLGLTGQVVKNGAGHLYAIQVTNLAAAARYVKVYNKATAPTQADTPVFTFAVPASTVAQPANFPHGVAFSTGISLRASNAIADNDTTAPTANDVVVNVGYK